MPGMAESPDDSLVTARHWQRQEMCQDQYLPMRVANVPMRGACAAGEALKLPFATVKLPRPVGPSKLCASSSGYLGGWGPHPQHRHS